MTISYAAFTSPNGACYRLTAEPACVSRHHMSPVLGVWVMAVWQPHACGVVATVVLSGGAPHYDLVRALEKHQQHLPDTHRASP